MKVEKRRKEKGMAVRTPGDDPFFFFFSSSNGRLWVGELPAYAFRRVLVPKMVWRWERWKYAALGKNNNKKKKA